MDTASTILNLLESAVLTELKCCSTCQSSWINYMTGCGYCKDSDIMCPKPITEADCCDKWILKRNEKTPR